MYRVIVIISASIVFACFGITDKMCSCLKLIGIIITLKQVEEAQNELCRWTSETETFRQKHKVLAFFSNEKVMRILKHLQGTPSPDCLVKEISFLFECDSENIQRLTQKVKVSVSD